METEFVDLEKYKISRYDEEKNKYFYLIEKPPYKNGG